MSNSQVTLKVLADTKSAVTSLREFTGEVKKSIGVIRDLVKETGADLRALTFDPGKIVRGTDEAARGLQGVGRSAGEAARQVETLQTASGEAEGALKGLGAQAGSADKKVGGLTTTSEAVAEAFGTLATASEAADVALDSLDAGAATAQKSVAGLGRSAAATLPKLEALNGAAFDPARIMAGADEGTAALGRLRSAAASVRGALRGASGAGLPPVFAGGRRVGAGGEERPLTFRQGLHSGAGAIGDIGTGVAAITTLVAAATGKLSANFDNVLQGAKGNTTMSAGDMVALRAQVLRDMKTGSRPEELVDAYKHIVNLGFKGEGARRVLDVSNRFGIGTQTPIGETGDVLARLLNDYHAKPEMASRFANTVHFAAAGSNMEVKALERNSSRTVGLAANYMDAKGLPDVLAAFGALVKNMTPAKADTQISGMLGQIAVPTPKAQKRAAALGLGGDFNAVGLRAEGLEGVVDKVKAAVDRLPAKEKAAALKDLFNNKQGGIGASFLTGSRHEDYKHLLNDPKEGTRAAFAGKIDAINPNYNAQMKQTTQAFKALSGEIQADFIPIGEKMGPVFVAAIPLVRGLANVIKTLMDGFTRLPKPAQEAILAIGGLKLLSSFLPLLSGFSVISEKTGVVLGGLGRMLVGIGPAAAEGAAGAAGLAAVLGGPFLAGVGAAIAIAAGLALAWRKDFGGIREFVGGQVKQIVGFFRSELPQIQQTVRTVLATIQQFWSAHGSRILAIVRPLWSFVKDTIVNALHVVENVVKLVLAVINGDWKTAGSALKGIVGSLWSEIKSLFSNGVKAVGNILAGIVELLVDLGKRAFAAGAHLGDSIMTGIKNGISAKMGQVANAAHALGSLVVTAAKGALDSHSPSRKMHQLGLDAAHGLTNGLTAGQGQVEGAATRLSDIVWKRFGIRHAARMSGKDPGSARTLAADRADYQQTTLTAQGSDARQAAKLDAHRFDHAFDTQSAGDTHVHARWENRTADNASYEAYLEGRKKQLAEWGAAHKAWLDAHEVGAKRFAGIEQRIDTSLQEVNRRMAEAKAKASEINAQIKASLGEMDDNGPDKYSRMLAGNDDQYEKQKKAPGVDLAAAKQLWQRNHDAIAEARDQATNEAGDKRHDWDYRNGAQTAQNTLSYFQQRQAQLVTQGKTYTDEWYRISEYVIQIQHGITEAEKSAVETEGQSVRERFDALKENFTAGAVSADDYKASLAGLQAEIAKFGMDHATATPLLEPIRHDLGQASANVDHRAKQKATREMVGGAEFWDGMAGSAGDAGSKVLTALLHPRDSKSIFKGLWADLLGSAESGVTGSFSKMIKNMLTGGLGSGGGGASGGIGGWLRRLFGGGRKASAGAGSVPGAASSLPGLASAAGLPNFGGAGSSGGFNGGSLAALSGLPAGNLLNTGMGAFGQLQGINGAIGGFSQGGAGGMMGGLSSLLPMLGHGGMLGGLLGHGGLAGMFAHGGLMTGSGALGGVGAAMPWLAGGLLAYSLLKKPLGKLFKHLHFAQGGFVPGHGTGDTVPAMLTPGEFILSRPMLKSLSGPTPQLPSFGSLAMPRGISGTSGDVGAAGNVVHMHGDHHYHSEMDIQTVKKAWSKDKEAGRRRNVPTS